MEAMDNFSDKGTVTYRSSSWRDPLDDVRTMSKGDVEDLVEQHGELEAQSLIVQAAHKQLASIKLRAEVSPTGRRLAMERRDAHGRRQAVTDYESTKEPAARWDASRGEYRMTPTRAGFSDALNTRAIWNTLDAYSDEVQAEIMTHWRARFGDTRPTIEDIHEVARWLERRRLREEIEVERARRAGG